MAYFINDDCVCCEKCREECPAGAIYRREGIMKIDAEKCVGCGTCASVCNLGAPVDLTAEPVKPKKHPLVEKDCDLVVLGGGGAGLVAAARAAYLSKRRVIVLEKAKKTGGGAWFAADFKVFNSKWQKERNIPDMLDQSVLAAMDATYWKLDGHLVDACFHATGEFFDWLCETSRNAEDNFQEGRYIFDGPEAPVFPVFKKRRRGKQGGTGKFVMDQMLSICKELGVEVLTGHAASDVVVKNGKIVAVIADDPGGQTRVNCKACVLATGSWINNQKILERVSPKFAGMETGRSPHRNPAYTGDGIKLAEKAGAFVDYDSFCLRLMGPMMVYANEPPPYRTLSSMMNGPSAIFINKNGKRWINERTMMRTGPFNAAVTLLDQPEGVSFTLFDANCIEHAVAQYRSGHPVDNGFFGAASFPEDWQADLDAAIAEYGEYVKKADTLSDLAALIDVDAYVLAETVVRYNEQCAVGRDADFFKAPDQMVPLTKGPYYAVVNRMATDGAFGGVLVNADTQAYAKDHSLVDGLYVVGDFASGRFVNMSGVKVQIINDLAWAFSSGFMAGSSVARYLGGAQ
jgi:succinate dehydrogenase/fumarate reductase flavoprotein subunit